MKLFDIRYLTGRDSERIWAFSTAVACVLTGAMILGAYFVFDGAAPAAARYQNIVLLMRHGDAPGYEEPRTFNLVDCSTQRNLSAKGRIEAKETGSIIRAQALNIRSVISSRWCRTRETAEMLALSSVKPEPAFDNMDFNRARFAELLEAERKIIREWNGPGILLIVTHSSNIKALSGLSLEAGSMIIADPNRNGDIQYRLSSIVLRDLFL